MKYSLILILFFLPGLLFAQGERKQREIGLGTGVDCISFRDYSSSPLSYSGFGLPLLVFGKIEGRQTKHEINVSAISARLSNNYPLKNRSNTQLLTWEKATFQYRFFHRLKDSLNYLGGSWNAMMFYREYDFLDGQSYEFISSLDLHYRRVIPILKKYRIEADLSLPILGYIHRKPTLTLDERFLEDLYNNGNILQYGRWKMLFSQWFEFNIRLRNQFPISERLSLTAEIGMEFYSIHFPEQVINLSYPVLCYVHYRF